jgi:transposase
MVITVLAYMWLLLGSVVAPPRRDFEAMERRRRRAARLFEQGKTQADVVRALEVSRQSVSRWYAEWTAGGAAALKRAPKAGRPAKLTGEELRAVERVLKRGACAYGFTTDLWTLERVADVIENETGVRYHPGHIWKILRAMGWSRQRPARRALERDDEAIATWVADRWPRVKKTPGGGGRGSSSKTSRGSRPSPR